MGKTGGGAGSNQYGPHGTPKVRATTRKVVRPPAPPIDLTPPPQAVRLGEVHAVVNPACDTDILESAAGRILARGVARGLARWQHNLPNLVWNDAALEGNLFTLPDVQTLLDGGAVRGYTVMDVEQVRDLSNAAQHVAHMAVLGPASVSSLLSDTLNGLLTAHETLEPGALRGEGRVGGEAVVGARSFRFVALPTIPGGQALRAVFNESAARANSLRHPVARGAAWAGLAAYHQFYSNGNKRTARYVMNTVLLSCGFDAIVTPAARRDEYNDALESMYRSGDVTGYARFLISLYNDSH